MIDRGRMPDMAAAFAAALHGPLFVPLSDARCVSGDFPKLFLNAFAVVAGVSPYLVNLWTFDDPEAKARVVGGIDGPSKQPDRDWRSFRDAAEALGRRDAREYAALLDEVDEIVSAYALSARPFHPSILTTVIVMAAG